MQLIVNLKAAACQIHCLSDCTGGVLEFQPLQGQVNHFNNPSINEGNTYPFKVYIEGQGWLDLLGDGFEGLIATRQCV